MDITFRIKQIIDAEKLNITQFAEKIGVKRQRMQDVMSNRQKPTQDLLVAIVEILHINGTWLLTGKGNMYITEQPEEEPTDVVMDNIRGIVAELDRNQQIEIYSELKEKKRINDLTKAVSNLQQIIEDMKSDKLTKK